MILDENEWFMLDALIVEANEDIGNFFYSINHDSRILLDKQRKLALLRKLKEIVFRLEHLEK